EGAVNGLLDRHARRRRRCIRLLARCMYTAHDRESRGAPADDVRARSAPRERGDDGTGRARAGGEAVQPQLAAWRGTERYQAGEEGGQGRPGVVVPLRPRDEVGEGGGGPVARWDEVADGRGGG